MNSERPLTIAHVVEACDGGVATFVAMLAGSQLRDPRFAAVHVLVDQKSTQKSLLDLPIIFHRYISSRNPVRAFGISRQIRTILNEIKADVVLLHSTFPGLWGRIIVGRKWRLIYCPHGWAFAQDVIRIKKIAYALVEMMLSRSTDMIVSVSRDEYDRAHAAGVRGAPHIFIRHGVPLASPADGPMLAMAEGTVNLAFVGRFERQKGFDILCQILDDPRLANIHFWLVGNDVRGGTTHDFKSITNLHQLGWRSGGEVDAILQQVDGLIVPSRWEGFGLVAIEAMRNGRAVIANRVGGLTELVEDGVNGCFIDITDLPRCRALLAQLTKPELHAMGRNAYRIYQEKYRWDDCYARWAAMIVAVAANQFTSKPG